MATGTATLDFGATPTDEATVTVTGLSGLTANTHIEPFVQGGDSTADHTSQDHKFLAISARMSAEYVSATSFSITANLLIGLVTGTFTVHYATQGA